MRSSRVSVALVAAGAVAATGLATAAIAVGDGLSTRVQGGEQSVEIALGANVERIIAEKRRARQALEPTLRARRAYLANASGRRGVSARQNPRQGAITACVNKKTKVMSLKGSCSAKETKISWNRSGPAGPAGPTGSSGPVGPGGPAGPSGSNASAVFYEDVYGPTTVAPNDVTSGFDVCSFGGSAISGGFLPTDGNLAFVVRASLQSATDADQWFSVIQNTGGTTGGVYTLVYCAL